MKSIEDSGTGWKHILIAREAAKQGFKESVSAASVPGENPFSYRLAQVINHRSTLTVRPKGRAESERENRDGNCFPKGHNKKRLKSRL